MNVPPELADLAAAYIERNLATIYEFGKNVLGGAKNKARLQLKGTYSSYIASAGSRYGRSKSFFIRSAPTDIYEFYVPLGVTCGEHNLESVSLAEIESLTKRAIITGTAGCGKSMLLRHLFLSTLRQGSRIPVLVELRSMSSMEAPTSLIEMIESSLSDHSFNLGSSFIEMALNKGHFVILLDGLDEVPVKQRKKLGREIIKLSLTATDCVIILSSRPDDSFSNWEEFSDLTVNPLSLDDACKLISKLPHDEEIKKKFTRELQASLFELHESFLSNPLLLSIMLLTYGQYAEIPHKLSLFYDHAYEALFQKHDALKGGFQRDRLTRLDIQDFAKVFSAFCVRTYNQHQFQLSRTECLAHLDKSKIQSNIDVQSDKFLDDCLQSVCLLLEDGVQIAFAHRSFQEYFVATFINQSAPSIQKKLMDKFDYSLDRDSIFTLLLEMNRDLVEREFILPRLSSLFRKLKIGRQVGITHFLRYLNLCFSEIRFPDRSKSHIGLTLTSDRSHPESLSFLQFALRSNPEYTSFDEISGDDVAPSWREVADRYSVKGEERVLRIKELTIRTPLLREMSKMHGPLSLNALQSAYRQMKALTKKHENVDKSLEALLT